MIRTLVIITLFFSIFFECALAQGGFVVETLGNTNQIVAKKRLVERILSSDRMEFGYSALSVILDTGMVEPRGQMKGRMIRLSPHIERESEFVKLLVHELAHYIDIFYLSATQKLSDPSGIFYAISWEGKKTKKPSESLSSFISGYAATNQYEDFAESFTFYVFHNEDFAERALKNESLRKKYLFLQEYVFSRGAFVGTDFSLSKIPSYLWDTTKIPISVKKYLFFLNS